MREGGADGRRRLVGKFRGVKGREGVGPGGVHAGGDGRSGFVGADAEVAEHGVGFPPADEFDEVGVDVGTEHGGGATRAEAADGEAIRRDAGGGLDGGSGGAQGDGGHGCGDHVPCALVEWAVRAFAVGTEVAADAGEGAARAVCQVL